MISKLAILTAACLMISPAGLRAEDALPPAITPATLPAVPMKRVPFVGILTVPVQLNIAKQMNLCEGMGLVIADIAEASPAQKSGLLKQDVLTKLDDQLLCNPQQLQTLIRSRKKGDTVTFAICRDGKEMTLPVQLGESEVPAVQRNVLIFRADGVQGGNPVLTEMPIDIQTINQLHQSSGGAMTQATMAIDDNEHVIKATINDGKMDVSVKDHQGKVLYDGPIMLTADGKVDTNNNKDVPQAILDKLQRSVNVTNSVNVKVNMSNEPTTQPVHK